MKKLLAVIVLIFLAAAAAAAAWVFVGTRRMVVYDDLRTREKIRIYDARVERPPFALDQPHLRIIDRVAEDGAREVDLAWGEDAAAHGIRVAPGGSVRHLQR